jgi:hypothetical protein
MPKKQKKEYKNIPISNEALEEVYNKVISDPIYGEELTLVKNILNRFPKNDDLEIVAMKVALIDVTNSTHFAQHKKKINLFKFAKFIVEIENFDELVANGDHELIKKLSKNYGKINLFSLATKYCQYHNWFVYGKDDYSKYDDNVSHCIPLYINEHKLNYSATKNLYSLAKNGDYHTFHNIIDELLKDVTVENKRTKFDYLIWYYNR